jgi:hypothetical protein
VIISSHGDWMNQTSERCFNRLQSNSFSAACETLTYQSCPDTKLTRSRVFPQPFKLYPRKKQTWTGRSTLQPANHPTDEDLSVGTPANHPTDEDLSVGTPAGRPALQFQDGILQVYIPAKYRKVRI